MLDYERRTPLHTALEDSDDEMVALLLVSVCGREVGVLDLWALSKTCAGRGR